jgi:hypothetical protein
VCEDERGGQQGPTLTTEERHRILRRLHSTLGWVGVRIPEELCLDGERVQLRDKVDRFVFDDHIDEDERKEVLALIDKLEDKAEILEDELEVEDLTLEEAERILNRAIGVLRAIDELQHLDDEDEWEDRHRDLMERVDDAKRWRDFTKRVYKKDEYY